MPRGAHWLCCSLKNNEDGIKWEEKILSNEGEGGGKKLLLSLWSWLLRFNICPIDLLICFALRAWFIAPHSLIPLGVTAHVVLSFFSHQQVCQPWSSLTSASTSWAAHLCPFLHSPGQHWTRRAPHSWLWVMSGITHPPSLCLNVDFSMNC